FAESGRELCALSNAVANPPSGSSFAVGTNIVAVTGQDMAGNTNTCTFKVTVLAGAPPTLNIPQIASNAVLSWSGDFPCYTLQYATLLESNSWSDYPGPFATNGGSV